MLTLSHFINLSNPRYYVSLSEIFADAPSLWSHDTRAEDRDLLPHIQVSLGILIITDDPSSQIRVTPARTSNPGPEELSEANGRGRLWRDVRLPKQTQGLG